MAWFAWQSVLFILGAFVLGLLVGYWFWRIQWRRVAFTESEAVTVISRRHEKALGERDTEIHRLRGLLGGGAVAATAAGAVVAADGGDVDLSKDSTPEVDLSKDTPDVDLSKDIDLSGRVEGLPEVVADADLPDVNVPDVNVPDVNVPDGDTTVVSVPASGHTVVDVTDGTVSAADADPEASARAVAHLPTQGGEGQEVIDLASLEGTAGEAAQAGQDAIAAGPAATDGEAPSVEGTDLPAADAEPGAEGVAAGLITTGSGADDESAGDGTEDDLERIEGIGPRIASALRTAGIRTFRRLADTDVPTLQVALEAAGLRFAPSLPTWSRQARFLADGDEVGFIKLTESLVAGREPGRSR